MSEQDLQKMREEYAKEVKRGSLNTCASCKHWRQGSEHGFGKCSEFYFDPQAYAPPVNNPTARVQVYGLNEDELGGPRLTPGRDFGCIHWEAKTTG